MKKKSGFFSAAVLCMGVFNPSLGLPASLLLYIREAKTACFLRRWLFVAAILVLKVLWVAGVDFLFGGFGFSTLQVVSSDIALLLLMYFSINAGCVRGLFLAAAMLFFADFLFNLSTVLTGADLLGRAAGVRPDDLIPRLGGVLYHPFYSINISIMMFLLAYMRRNSLFMLFSALNVFWNGSFRGVLLFLLCVFSIFLVRSRVKIYKLYLFCLLFVAAVVLMTVWSVSISGIGSGNYFRVVAWLISINKIAEYPYYGFHAFEKGVLPSVSEENIASFGIGESQYFDYALHYGVGLSVLHLMLMCGLLNVAVGKFYAISAERRSEIAEVAAVLSIVCFVDSFYGTFLSSMLVYMCFGLIVFSRDK